MSTVAVALSKLHLSQHNVRHPVEGDPANDVHDLQASILAQGLMNPLQVHPLKKPKGHYAVHAGGRRLRALLGLVEDGKLPAEHEVDCYISDAPAADLAEASLAENLVRVALKPTAEFEAFAALAAAGMDEAEIAQRYAVTVLHVRQRMRLGRLHPTILAALDEGRISLDLAKAYAATEDQALQARVFGEMAAGYNHQPHNVRNAIRGGSSAYDTEKMLGVVGIDAYVAAGGAIEEDLFGGGHRVVHPGTLADLYYPKLEAMSAELAKQLPERVTIATSAANVGRYVHVHTEPSEEQRDRLTEIDARSEQIGDQLEQLGEDDGSGAIVATRPDDQSRIEQLLEEQDRLQDEAEKIHDEAPEALPDGPLVAVAEPGADGMRVTAYYRPAGWVDPNVTGGSSASGDAAAASLDKPIGLDPRIGFGDPKPAVKAETGLTADAIEVMRTHRRAALRAMMVDERGGSWSVAAALLPFMVLRNLLGAEGRRYGIRGNAAAELGAAQGSFATAYGPVIALAKPDEFTDQPCARRWTDTLAYLEEQEWLTEPDLRRAFALFTVAPDRMRELAGAAAAALLLDRSLNAPGFRVPLHDELALLMGQGDREELRKQWVPDEAFFSRLPKSRRLEAVEAISPAIAREIGKLPTGDIAAACALIFSGSDQARKRWRMQPAMIANARRWVPEFLAFGPDAGSPRLADVIGTERAEEMAA